MAGIVVTGAGAVTIEDNSISRNQIGIFVAANSASLVIDGNNISNNTMIGIAISNSTGATLFDNYLVRNGSADGGAGIALFNSQNIVVTRNNSSGNIGDGIFADKDSTGNTFLSNVLIGNSGYDAEDLTTGSGTLGTANTWTKNVGKTSTPKGLVSMAGEFRRFHFGCGR